MADETRECRIRLAFAHAAHAIAGATLEDAVTAAFADSSLPVPKPSYTKCAKWHQRLLDTGGVEALPRGRHEPTLTDEEVKAASDLIKAGHAVTVQRKRRGTRQEVLPFHTIGDAVLALPQLQDLLKTKGVSMKHLLRRLHEVDTDLKWVKQQARRTLLPKYKEERQKCAEWLLAEHAKDPNFLRRVVWIDEFKADLFDGNPQDVRGWYDRRDDGVDAVAPVPGLANPKRVHVCCYVAVSADLGLVAFQFTSGTTELRTGWPLNKLPAGLEGAETADDPNYTVSGGLIYVLQNESWAVRGTLPLVMIWASTNSGKARGLRSPLGTGPALGEKPGVRATSGQVGWRVL
jgi:hypothetical protein